MTTLRIFISYDSTDTAFATQLITDLRDSGAEVITDSASLDDMAFEQFLSKELPQCQHLIVVQTQEALQSRCVRAAVDTALKQTQVGQMRGVLRVIAPTLNGVGGAGALPLGWAKIPEFDASQDYPRALARLCLYLGMGSNDVYDVPPLPSSTPPLDLSNPKGIREQSPLAASFHAQRSAEEDRPRRPLRYPRRQLSRRFFLLSLAMLLVLFVAGVVVLINRSLTHDKPIPGTPTPIVAIHTPIPTPTPKPTPAPRASYCTSLPNETDCTGRDPMYQGCNKDTITVIGSKSYVKGKDGNNIGYVELRYSGICQSKWAQTTVYKSCGSVNISANIQRPNQTYQGKEYVAAQEDSRTRNNNPACELNFPVLSPMVFTPGAVKAEACGSIQGSSLVCTI